MPNAMDICSRAIFVFVIFVIVSLFIPMEFLRASFFSAIHMIESNKFHLLFNSMSFEVDSGHYSDILSFLFIVTSIYIIAFVPMKQLDSLDNQNIAQSRPSVVHI